MNVAEFCGALVQPVPQCPLSMTLVGSLLAPAPEPHCCLVLLSNLPEIRPSGIQAVHRTLTLKWNTVDVSNDSNAMEEHVQTQTDT